MDLQDDLSTATEIALSDINKMSTSKNFITPKLVAALDRCQLSMRNSVYIIEATMEALRLNTDDYPINTVTVPWDGELLPALDMRKCKEECLPIVISYGDKEQLIAVPKLDNFTGSEQAQAVRNAVTDWNLKDKV
ncbi:hypothetical protein EVAR_39201_1 [Eumeta japonica]|uniref:Uncharacterized protein n=1 Tax=Eumeta variegata TaxID=151549 RepID=A0A4C1VMP9_EUMVA|nr:hypothetical protein EVAR_39201_1 [Eumeta japonica]